MIINFGKYKNVNISDIYQRDRQYLEWLNTQPWFVIKFKENHAFLTKFLNENNENIVVNKDTFIIYTDGACKNNGYKDREVSAGIGVHFSRTNESSIDDISEKLDIATPTNNKAELLAIDKSLELCIKNRINKDIVIYTDSQYSIDAITKWYDQWDKSGKLHSGGKKNIEYLTSIKDKLKLLDVSFIHVRGHTKKDDVHSLGNCIADDLATSCL